MGISESLQKQLSQLNPSRLKELNPEQMKQMLANLQAKSAACKNCQGNGSGQEGSGASRRSRTCSMAKPVEAKAKALDQARRARDWAVEA